MGRRSLACFALLAAWALGRSALRAGDAPPPPPVAEPAAKDAPDPWAKLPVVTKTPRPGYFPLPPTGPGFYSLADQIHGEERKGPPKYPYPRFSIIQPSMFDFDWRYLDDPKNTEHDYFDCLKRVRVGDHFLLTTGGEIRYRYDYEENSRLFNAGPTRDRGKDNHYDLTRLRLYADLMVTDDFRVFVEGISALSPNYRLPPVGIDRNFADLLNAFVDVRLMQGCGDESAWLRVGRQELLYGSQRLVSTLDWANTRRTFQGVKAFYRSAEYDVDAFVVQPIPVGPNPVGVRNVSRFDSVDENQVFAGLWNTWRPTKNQAIDAYYLFLDNTNPTEFRTPGPANTTRTRALTGATTVNTLGARYVGDDDGWLWDFEGMAQFGGFYGQQLFAGSLTAGGGYQWKDAATKPMLWLFYDYASGTDDPNVSGNNHTFNQLFPFGHYYMGFIDVVGRRNVHDASLYFTFWPQKWIQTNVQVHNFFLASRRDALYGANGLPLRQDVTGRSGNYVGTEFDLMVNFHLSKHSDVLLSYSYLIAGEFVRKTATTGSGKDDPQALYLQYSYRW